MVVSTQFHKFHRRSFARVLHFILMKDIGRRLAWMLPGCCQDFIKKWGTSAAGTINWMVGTQLCKLRGTSDTFVGRAYFIFHLQCGVWELNLLQSCSSSNQVRQIIFREISFYSKVAVRPQHCCRCGVIQQLFTAYIEERLHQHVRKLHATGPTPG